VRIVKGVVDKEREGEWDKTVLKEGRKEREKRATGSMKSKGSKDQRRRRMKKRKRAVAMSVWLPCDGLQDRDYRAGEGPARRRVEGATFPGKKTGKEMRMTTMRRTTKSCCSGWPRWRIFCGSARTCGPGRANR